MSLISVRGDQSTTSEVAKLTEINNLGDPNADRIIFWDDSASSLAYLALGAGLSITGTTLAATAATAANVALSNLANVAINTSLISDTDNLDALGSATIGWSDLFLGSGAVINFNNGDVTITHSANALDIDGGVVDFGSTPTVNGSAMARAADNLSVFAATTSLQLLGVISDETGTGLLVFGTAPTFTTSITDPLIIGGTGVASTLSLRSTSGIGAAGADIIFQTGNNGATEAMRILNNGNIGIGTAVPTATLDIGTSGGRLLVNSSNLASGGITAPTLQIGSGNNGLIVPVGTGLTLVGGGLGMLTLNSSDNQVVLASTAEFGFGGGASSFSTAADAAIGRNASGVIEINNGTLGTIADLRVRAINPTTGNLGIGTTAPSTLLHVGLAGTTLGTIGIAGNTSGLVTIQPAAAAGTWTFTLPTSGGTNNFALLTNGLGVSTWTAIPISITGTANQVVASAATGAVTLSLPQSIATTSTPQFGQLGVNRAVSGGSILQITFADDGTASLIQSAVASASVTTLDIFVDYRSDDGSIGSVSGTGVSGVIAFNTFTGSHWSQSDSIMALPEKIIKQRIRADKTEYNEEITKWNCDLAIGSVLVSTDEMCKWKAVKQEEEWTEINGKATMRMKNIEKDYDEPNETLPKCEVSSKAEDKRVYGVYGGHDKDGDILVLALGAGVIIVINEGGAIEVGDFLCTSSQKGMAKKYLGNDMRVVIAKARQSFNGVTGKIACTLNAG